MRHAFVCAVFLAFVAVAPGSPTALAQPIPPRINPLPSLEEASKIEYVSDVLAGTVLGRLNMRYNPRKSGPVTGVIFGDRIEGYRTLDQTTNAQSLAFVQFKRNAQNVEIATNIYTADNSPAQRAWMGVAHALDVPLGGASAAGNAISFRTIAPLGRLCANNPACVAQGLVLRPLPVVTSPMAIDAAAMVGFGIDANGQRGPLVLRAAAGGNNEGVLSGHVLRDAVSGHYARGAGTIVFLRKQNGQAIQVFTGVLDAGGIKGGRGFPLNASGGGGPFGWTVVTNDQIVSGLRSLQGRCLTPENPASGAGGILTTTATCTNNFNVSWVVFAVGANGGNSLFSLVSVATGLCLQMPGAAGAAVTQQVCSGVLRQSLLIEELQATGVLPDGSPTYTPVAINTAAAFGMTSNGLNLHAPGPNGSACLARVGAGEAVEFPCVENHKTFKAVVRTAKAIWTHNP